jgi:hypothetical protein
MMSGSRLTLIGAIYGGVVGPAIGGFLLAMHDFVKFHRDVPDFAGPEDFLVFPFVAVVLAGIPGAIIGALTGSWLCRVGHRAWIRGLIGAALGLGAAMFAVIALSAREPNPNAGLMATMKMFFDVYAPGALAGALCALLFPVKWVSVGPAGS